MAAYENNVFINCPFDDEYETLFRATVYTVQDCGYTARCSLETDDGSEVRINKIIGIVRECKLGIHDLSRTELDAASQLPRFNMPLELGIFLGAKHFGSGRQKTKSCLILERDQHSCKIFCSDIAGQDPKHHELKIPNLIRKIRDWLQSAAPQKAGIIPSGSVITNRFAAFQDELPILCQRLKLNHVELSYDDYVFLVSEWLVTYPWGSAS